MNIGVFLPNWVGDVVMATPALRAIRRHFGGARRIGILRPYLVDLLSGTDYLDECWPFDPRGKDARYGRRALVRRMRREHLDMVILMTNSLHTGLLAWLGSAKRRIGYDRYGRGLLLTERIQPPREGRRVAPMPVVDYYLNLATALGCARESPRLELATTDEEACLGEQIWSELGLRADGRVIVLNSSGAYGGAKLWPVRHTAELARRIVDQTDHDVLILCGPGERDTARQTARLADRRRVFSLADGPVGISASKVCLRRSRLMVSTDSGPRHIAAAFGKPVITMFGPTRPIWIENPTVRAVNLQLKLDCSGCGKRVCPLGHHRCMKELSVDLVFAEVAQLVKHHQASAVA